MTAARRRDFRRSVEALMQKHDVSQSKMADLLGVSRKYLNRLLNEEWTSPSDQLVMCVRWLRLAPDEAVYKELAR